MAIFGKRGKTLLASIPVFMSGPDNRDPRRVLLLQADFRSNEWEELCKDFLLCNLRSRSFTAHVCVRCQHRTALKLWSEKPQECPEEDARRFSFRCYNDLCNETFSNNGLVRQSDEHAILQLIDPQHFNAIPELPNTAVLTGFGDDVQRNERVILLRGNNPIFQDPAKILDFGFYGGAWVEVIAGDHQCRINLGGVIIKRR